jgi:small GTP-binding protein
MGVIKKKICMLGGSAVGKTSLVRRFVLSMFSDKYLTTVGVKIDQKTVTAADGTEVELVLWDIHGDDEFQSVTGMYMRGMAGFLLVADITRRETLNKAMDMHDLALTTVGAVPFILVINKSDLTDNREISDDDITELQKRGWEVRLTSAKDGTGVEAAFSELAGMMIR